MLLDTPNGERTYHLAAVGNDYLNAKLSTLYTSQANLQRDFNVTADLLLMANRTAAADPATTKALLAKVVADYPAFRLYESASWRDEQMKTFNSTVVIFDVLVAALALPSLLALVNTLAISVRPAPGKSGCCARSGPPVGRCDGWSSPNRCCCP